MYQKVIVVGNLGKDPEMRYMPNGNAVMNFSVAASEKWKNQDGSEGGHTEWFRCALFGKLAEALEPYMRKGKQVMVEGRMRTRKWQAQDGSDRYSTEMRVDEIKLLGGKGDRQSAGQSTGQSTGRAG